MDYGNHDKKAGDANRMDLTSVSESDVKELYNAAMKKGATLDTFESAVNRIGKEHGEAYLTSALYNARKRVLHDTPGMVMQEKGGRVTHFLGSEAYTKANEWMEQELRHRKHSLE